MIEKVEVVSSHFRYTEEYVMGKTPFWLSRKFLQADREMYEQKVTQAEAVSRGVSVVLDMIFNKGKQTKELLPSYEDALQSVQQEQSRKTQDDKFITSMWWEPGR